MTQRAIPCMFMRGGTSRGPIFLLEDLPANPKVRDRVLLAAMGSPDPRQIDGLGGATTVTSKVAMVSPSQRAGIDVDYRFAQVWLDKAIVDTAPSCGNMLAGVGPFAIERRLVTPDADETRVRIFDVNTGSRIEALVQTPGGTVTYAGDQRIDGCRAPERRSCSALAMWWDPSAVRYFRPAQCRKKSMGCRLVVLTWRCRW